MKRAGVNIKQISIFLTIFLISHVTFAEEKICAFDTECFFGFGINQVRYIVTKSSGTFFQCQLHSSQANSDLGMLSLRANDFFKLRSKDFPIKAFDNLDILIEGAWYEPSKMGGFTFSLDNANVGSLSCSPLRLA